MTVLPVTSFRLPPGAEAHEPPEHRGLARDGVRLLVARPGVVEHRRFHELADVLDPGDLLVVNTSATLPAALDARHRDGRAMALHVATELDDGDWVVEPRRPDGPERDVAAGDRLTLPGVVLTLVAPYPDEHAPRRLWRARPWPAVGLAGYLADLRAPDRVRAPRRTLPARGPPDRLRHGAGQRRDAERRAPAVRAAARPADGARRDRRPARAARRGVEPGEARAADGRAVPGAGVDGPSGQFGAGGRRAGRRGGDDRGAGARDRRGAGRDRVLGTRLDRPRPRLPPPGADRRRAGLRPARAGGEPPGAARGGGRAGARRAGVRGGRGRAVPVARVRRLDAPAAVEGVAS